MAAIDKIYGTTEQWDEFWTWCKANLPSARPYFYSRDGYPNGQERPITNFPIRIDRKLMRMAYDGNLPPLFVLEQSAEQYLNGFFLKPRGKIALICLGDRVVCARVNARGNKSAAKGTILDGDLSGRTIERETGGLWRLDE